MDHADRHERLLMRTTAIALLGAIAVACASPASTVPTPSGSQLGTLAPRPSPTSTAAASSAPVPALTRSPAPSPAMTYSRDDLSQYVTSLVPAGWKPWPVTILVAAGTGTDPTGSDPTTSTVTAVPLDSALGRPTELVRFTRVRGWSARDDGAIVVVLVTSTSSTRLAIWEPATARARWITPDEPGSLPQFPVWSSDGAAVYYALAPDTCQAPCFSIVEARADGSGTRRVYGPSDRFGQPQFVTPDGEGLVWSRGQAGGSTDVVDIASGVNRAFSPGGSTTERAGWRAVRPRALVVTGTCCAGIPRGGVSLWDDIGGTQSVAVQPRNADPLGASNAIWDRQGQRIAVTAIEETGGGGFKSSIVLMDEIGARRTPIPNTDGLFVRAWVAEGLIALRTTPRGGATEVVLVSPDTAATKVIHSLRDTAFVQVLTPASR